MLIRDKDTLRTLICGVGGGYRATARAAGWSSPGLLRRILVTGERSPTMTTSRAVRIACHLGVPIEDLFVVTVSSRHGRSGKSDGEAA
jgi:hypothetical protein